MITSMTGYGASVHQVDGFEVKVEVRSVNNRFLDLQVKTPRSLYSYEKQIRDLVGKYIKRGRVNLWVGIDSAEKNCYDLSLNENLVKAYKSLGDTLGKKFGIKGKLDVNYLLSQPDIITSENEDEADEKLWLAASQSIEIALKDMLTMREAEGAQLLKDFHERINALDEIINKIEKLAEPGPQVGFEKLRSRISKIPKPESIDEGRLELELALIADRVDITEECVRFHSHNKLFLELLDSGESEGRKLNFLLQEMNREANTMGTKAFSTEISHLAVNIKDEIEKIREQIQNIE